MEQIASGRSKASATSANSDSQVDRSRQAGTRAALLAMAAATLVLMPTSLLAESRTWHERSTGASFQGELVGAIDGKLCIRKEGSDTVSNIDPAELSVSDLAYAYEHLQGIISEKEKPPSRVARPADTDPPGEFDVEVKCSKELRPEITERISAPLKQQLGALGPFPPNTKTMLQLEMRIENRNVESFRLGRHSFTVLDSQAVCHFTIRRRTGRREKIWLSEKLELTSVEALRAAPQDSSKPITKDQLAEVLLAELIKKVQQWRVPDNVFEVTGN